MHRRTVITAAPLALAGCVEGTTTALEGPDAEVAAVAVREAINEERQAVNVATLSPSDRLQTAAREHSRDMHERDFYGHQNPDGEQPWDRVACRAGENIHRGEIGEMQNVDSDTTWNTFDTDELAGYVAEGWRLSEGHYELMTSARWQSVGVGIFIGEDEQFFATAMFC